MTTDIRDDWHFAGASAINNKWQVILNHDKNSDARSFSRNHRGRWYTLHIAKCVYIITRVYKSSLQVEKLYLPQEKKGCIHLLIKATKSG